MFSFTVQNVISEGMRRCHTKTTVMSEPSEEEDGGFSTFQMRQSRRSHQVPKTSMKGVYTRWVAVSAELNMIRLIGFQLTAHHVVSIHFLVKTGNVQCSVASLESIGPYVDGRRLHWIVIFHPF